MGYYYTLIKMTIKKKRKNLKILGTGKNGEQLEFSQTARRNVKLYSPFGKQFGRFSIKIKHALTIQPSHPSPRYLHRKLKAYIQTKTYIQMFITDLVIITKN